MKRFMDSPWAVFTARIGIVTLVAIIIVIMVVVLQGHREHQHLYPPS